MGFIVFFIPFSYSRILSKAGCFVRKSGVFCSQKRGVLFAKAGCFVRTTFFKPALRAGLKGVKFPNTFKSFKTLKGNAPLFKARGMCYNYAYKKNRLRISRIYRAKFFLISRF